MKTEQRSWSSVSGWTGVSSSQNLGDSAQVVFAFGNSALIASPGCQAGLREAYPSAHIVGCTTGGEIHGPRVQAESVSVTALRFDHSRVATAQARVDRIEASYDEGRRLIQQLDPAGLRHVVIFSDGLQVNGSDLVNGIVSALPPGATASGGCAADGDRLQKTFVWRDGHPQDSSVVALGFYGDRLRVGVSATGGWGPFGPDRLITKARKNVLYEFDGRPALALYKQYLGEYAAGLPAAGLMFPIDLRIGKNEHRVLRALLAVNETDQSITFAGNVPEGAYARFMMGHIEDLIGGSLDAASASISQLGGPQAEFALVVSCNARRAVLKQRVEEEIEAVHEGLGPSTTMAGFYSYGEIAPSALGKPSELHNETLVVTSFAEN
jgi:hypothetical protein